MIIAPKRLRGEVLDFATGVHVLGDDLRKMQRAHDNRLHEATILYATRILELTARHAVSLVGLEPMHDVYTNLNLVQHFGVLVDADAAWPHALRRIGNNSRHALAPVADLEVELAAVFLERWLDWLFCRHPSGPRLEGLTAGGGTFLRARDEKLAEWVRILETGATGDLERLAKDFADPGVTPNAGPWFVAMLAEKLIAKGHELLAQKLLKRHPNDFRIRQLQALAFRRLGKPERARKIVDALCQGRPDQESLGIAGGVYKALSDAASDRTESKRLLDTAAGHYSLGWKNSNKQNTYLGINAAAITLWLGDKRAAKQLALEIRGLIERRCRRIRADAAILGLWERLTLAEACLLGGDTAAALREYRRAIGAHPQEAGSIGTALRQATRDCGHLKLDAGPFLELWPSAAGPPPTVKRPPR